MKGHALQAYAKDLPEGCSPDVVRRAERRPALELLADPADPEDSPFSWPSLMDRRDGGLPGRLRRQVDLVADAVPVAYLVTGSVWAWPAMRRR